MVLTNRKSVQDIPILNEIVLLSTKKTSGKILYME